MNFNELYWEQFFKDCGLENFNISFQEQSEKLDIARGMIGFHFRLPIALIKFNTPSHSYYTKSAFVIQHFSAGNLALRSLCDAICGSYNAASILLRSVFELDMRGAFFQCLTEDKYFSNPNILYKNKKGRNLLKFLKHRFNDFPNCKLELMECSIGIFDELESVIDKFNYRINPLCIFQQLENWNIFNPIDNPKEKIYNNIFSRLSSDVHVMLDRTDIGKLLLKSPENMYEVPKFDNQFLQEYIENLNFVIDSGVILTCNLLKENLEDIVVKESINNLIKEFHNSVNEFSFFQEWLKNNTIL